MNKMSFIFTTYQAPTFCVDVISLVLEATVFAGFLWGGKPLKLFRQKGIDNA